MFYSFQMEVYSFQYTKLELWHDHGIALVLTGFAQLHAEEITQNTSYHFLTNDRWNPVPS